MVSRRRIVLALGAGALASPLAALGRAQTTTRIRRIGFLATRSRSTPSKPDAYYDAFVQGMRELGYVEGKNLTIEWRFADGKYERIPKLAAELVASDVEVIASHATPTALALQRATKSTPIVFMSVADPVASGLVTSLARPGGNLTGLSNFVSDIGSKLVQFLREIFPKLSRIAFLVNPDNPYLVLGLRNVQTAAKLLEIERHGFQAAPPRSLALMLRLTPAQDQAG